MDEEFDAKVKSKTSQKLTYGEIFSQFDGHVKV